MLLISSLAPTLFGALEARAAGHDEAREQAIVFPSLGKRVPGGWEIEIHGWVFEPENRGIVSALLGRVVGLDEGELRASEKGFFKERTKYFFADSESKRTFSLQVGNLRVSSAPSGHDGHFSTRMFFTDDELRAAGLNPGATNHQVVFTLTEDGRHTATATAVVRLLEDTGLSVISDIDNTIKISQVREKKELLRNTFCRPFQPVPGMARVYQRWATATGAEFHYVSASPWQLYVPLSGFVQTNGFPPGTFHPKNFRVKDQTFFDLFRSPETYKRSVIGPMLERFPERRFVLVGDSGEKDPEIYGALAREQDNQISRILIHEVTGEAADSARYRKAFAELPTSLWTLFKKPAEIEGAVKQGEGS